MGINASKAGNDNGGSFKAEILEPGVYPARLVQIIDFGVQAQRPFQGKEKAPVQEIGLTYELVDEFLKDEDGNDLPEKPRWQSEMFPLHNLKADRAKSTQRYFALDPTNECGGNFGDLVGRPCNVTLVHNVSGDKTYVNVAGISAMRPRDADKCDPLVNDPRVFDLDEPDVNLFRSLPEWIQERIKGNLHYNGSKLEAALAGGEPEKKAAKPKPARKAKEAEPEADAPDEGGEGDDDLPW